MLMLIFALIFNLVVSIWNARVCGLCWVEANAIGGWGKAVIWSGATQSVVGFTTIVLFLEALVATLFFHAGPVFIGQMASLAYVLMIVPAIGTGLVILVHTWMVAYRQRNFENISTAALNTITMANNIAGASSGLSTAFDGVTDLFEDDDGWQLALVLIAVVIAIGGGWAMTYAIIQHYKGRMCLPFEMEETK